MIAKILRRLLLLMLLLALGAGGVGYYIYDNALKAPLHAGENSIISVPKGSGITAIARELKVSHGLPEDWPLVLYGRLNSDAGKIQAGDYRIADGMTAIDILNDMKAGKVIVLQFRLIEGKTAKDLLKQIAADPDLKHTLTGKSDAEIAQALGIDGSLEGQFLPETYHYTYGTTDLQLLKRMHAGLSKTLDREWQQRAAGLPLKTPYEALILASIIEKETGIASEREQVSGVFNRRLQQGMRLQTDPSVIYGMADYTGAITRQDLQTDTPYNTYTRDGLPPTPIALPGRASIHAALNPDSGTAIYFVANGTGGHTFSTTYAEHQKAVQQYHALQKQKKP